MITANKYKDIILEHFYLHEDGTVRRKQNGYHNRYKKDDIVIPFQLCSHGYYGIHIPTTRRTIPYHHLLLVLNDVDIPDNAVIDHINGDTTDNSISNIRIVTQQINCRNRRKRNDNTTGITGITKAGNSYIVRVQLNGTRKYLGSRTTLEEAKELLDSYNSIMLSDGYTERHGK